MALEGDNTDESSQEESTDKTDSSSYADILSQFTSKDKSPKLSVSDILPKNKERRTRKTDNYPETGDNSYYDYYPAMKEPLQTGTYSGSIVGSNPIYSTAALFPYGLIDNRQNALARAADAKAADDEAWAMKYASLTAPTTKHAAVNPDLTDMFHKGLGDILQKHNGDAKEAFKSGEPQKYAEQVNNVAKLEDFGANLSAQYEHDVSEGKRVPTEFMDNINNKFKSGEYHTMLMNTNPDEAEKAKEIFQLKSAMNMDDVADKMSKSIQSDEKDIQLPTTHEGLYDILTTKETKGLNPDSKRFKDAADGAYDQFQKGRPDAIPKSEWYNMLASRFGQVSKIKQQVASTKGNDHGFTMSEKDLSHAPVDIISAIPTYKSVEGEDENGAKTYTVVPVEGKNTHFPVSNYFPMPAGSPAFTMAASSDIKDVSGNMMSDGKLSGNQQVVPSGVGISYIFYKPGSVDNGKVINEKDIPLAIQGGAKITAEPIAILSVQEKGDKGGMYTKGTITTGIDNVSNSIQEKEKNGKLKSGVDVELIKNKAKEAQARIDAMQGGTKKTITRTGINKTTGKKVYQYSDGTIEEEK